MAAAPSLGDVLNGGQPRIPLSSRIGEPARCNAKLPRLDRVPHLAALAVAGDEAGPVQDREMLDDRLPADRQLGRDYGGGRLSMGSEQVKDLPPGGIGERREDLSDWLVPSRHAACFSVYSCSSMSLLVQPAEWLS